MGTLNYVKLEKVGLKSNAEYNEGWVQKVIAEDPAILGLGELVLKDKERMQPKAGRLDLLLQDPESDTRYEVEVQLGSTDESHIIRTIEYWDIEKKRFPQYDHVAVLVAEDITARFLNVIGLFNGHIPLVAIQMHALKHENSIALNFTTVLDQMTLGLEEEDEESSEVTDRAYWEKAATKETVGLADKLLGYIHSFAPAVELKYNKFYIGLAVNGQPDNFVIFRPRKSVILLELRLPKSDELQKQMAEQGLDLLGLNRWGRYRIRLTAGDVDKHRDFLLSLMKQAHAGGSE
jgi:predicted transport protein